MKKFYIIFVFINFISSAVSAQQIRYHKFRGTGSSCCQVEKWNISGDSLPREYIKEVIDELGRVSEIMFLANDEIIIGACGDILWHRYVYPNDTTIVHLALNPDGTEHSSIECETWWKTTYTIDKSQRLILDSRIEFMIDTSELINLGWNPVDLRNSIKETLKLEIKPAVILGFDKSCAKLDGKYPIVEGFDIEQFEYQGIEYEAIMESILKK